MAELLEDADLIAIQEVVLSEAGHDAVTRLDAALDARGGDWDWTISNPTSGRGSERYAFLWRTDRVAPQGTCWLDRGLEAVVDREPFLCRFAPRSGGPALLLATMHTVPTSRNPAQENARLGALHDAYPDDALVLCGDFNLDAERPAFDGLRERGLLAALDDVKTTFKAAESPSGEHLASEYDNCFFESSELELEASGAVDFYGRVPTLREARHVSDHLPIYARFSWD